MRKIIFKTCFIFALLIFGIFLSACTRQAANTVQNSTENKGGGEASAPVDNSAEKNAAGNEISNTQPNARSNVQVSATPDKEQKQKTIDRYIAGVAKVSDAEEYKEARKILDGDLDGDGDEDAAVQFTIEGMGGGNNYGFYLAVFRNENGKFTAVTDEVIGGKLNRDVEFKKIENGKMYFDTKSYGKDDGACCPSIPGKTGYILEGNKLKEVKTKSENKK